MLKYKLVIGFTLLLFGCSYTNGTKIEKKFKPKITDTLYLGCYMIDSIKPKLISDKIFYINFDNQAVLKTVDSIIAHESVDNTRKWIIVENEPNYKLVYSMDFFIFCNDDDLSNTYFTKNKDKLFFIELEKDKKRKHLIDKNIELILRHPPVQSCDIPFDHPKTFIIDQKGKVISSTSWH